MLKSGQEAPQYTEVTSYSQGPAVRHVAYASRSTEELREMVDPPWPAATRAQLLAYFHNRYPCGYYVEIEAARNQAVAG